MVIIRGEEWQIQIVMYPLKHGFEVIHHARLIRVQYQDDCETLVSLVSEATLLAASHRFVGAVN